MKIGIYPIPCYRKPSKETKLLQSELSVDRAANLELKNELNRAETATKENQGRAEKCMQNVNLIMLLRELIARVREFRTPQVKSKK